MNEPVTPETLGQRIEQILSSDDPYEKITGLAWLIHEEVCFAVARSAARENWVDEALKVGLEVAQRRYDNLYTRYHEDLRRVLDIWHERESLQRKIAESILKLNKEKEKNRLLRAKVKELQKGAHLGKVRKIVA